MLSYRQATEKTDKTSTSDVSVVIFPEDVNDNAPLFQMKNYVIKVSENTPIGTVIYHDFIVSDADILVSNIYYCVMCSYQIGQK